MTRRDVLKASAAGVAVAVTGFPAIAKGASK
jgi:hypothetical protein